MFFDFLCGSLIPGQYFDVFFREEADFIIRQDRGQIVAVLFSEFEIRQSSIGLMVNSDQQGVIVFVKHDAAPRTYMRISSQ